MSLAPWWAHSRDRRRPGQSLACPGQTICLASARNPWAPAWHASRERQWTLAALAPAYLPRRPTETVLYGLVRQHLESFLAYAREHYEGGLPRYVEDELRAYLKCGVFSEGFVRARCDRCGHDLLVAFSCKSRTLCPSCSGRRMAGTAAAVVDRVLPDVPVRQYVLSLPFELRKLAAFEAPALTALGRIFVDAIFGSYRARAKRRGLEEVQCGAINFVQRFGSSLNLNVHFHVVVLDGVWTRQAGAGLVFDSAAPPTLDELGEIVERVRARAGAWLRRHGHLDDSPLEVRTNEPPAQTALDVCASIAMARGRTATLAAEGEPANEQHALARGSAGAVDRDGFNLHAGVSIRAGDDAGREKLCRYAARPALSLERLRRIRGGRFAYHLKYVRGGRGKYRLMEPMECLARLAALIAPPRYPLVRYAGVLGPRSAWRKEIVPRPRAPVAPQECVAARSSLDGGSPNDRRDLSTRTERRGDAPGPDAPARAELPVAIAARVSLGEVERLSANMISVRHWDRLLGGVLYAATPRIDWARLLRRSLDVDVLNCPKCAGRLRVIAAITERASVQRVLAHLGLPTEAPSVARARDPTDDVEGAVEPGQLELAFG